MFQNRSRASGKHTDITQDKDTWQGVTSLHVLTYVKTGRRLSGLQGYFKVGDGLGDKADSPKMHQFQTELTHKVTCGFGPYETLTNSVDEFILLLLTRFHGRMRRSPRHVVSLSVSGGDECLPHCQ